MAKINLLPKELREKRYFYIPSISGIRILIISVIIFSAAVTAFLFMAVSSVESNIEDLREEEEQALVLKQRLEEAQTEHERLSERLTLLEAIGDPVLWSQLLDGIHSCTPSDVWLEQIEAEAGEAVSIRGKGMSYRTIGNFFGCLQRLPEVVMADVTTAEKVDNGGVQTIEFEIMCRFEVSSENDESGPAGESSD